MVVFLEPSCRRLAEEVLLEGRVFVGSGIHVVEKRDTRWGEERCHWGNEQPVQVHLNNDVLLLTLTSSSDG